MINGIIIDDALQTIFSGYPRTPEVLDFYIEVKADVRERAEDLLTSQQIKDPKLAVTQAVKELGDLTEVLQMIAGQSQSTSNSVAADAMTTDQTVNETFTTAAIDRITLTAKFGNALLETSPDAAIHIQHFQTPKLKSYQLQIAQTDKTLALQVPTPNWLKIITSFRYPHSKVVIQLPKTFAGTLQLDLSSGLLYLDQLQTPDTAIKTQVKSGRLQIDQTQLSGLNAQAASGSVAITQAAIGELVLNAKSGSVQLKAVKSHFYIGAHSGSIRGSQLTGSGDFAAHSGSIRLDWAALMGNINLSAHSGSIKMQTPITDAFNFNLQTAAGTVKVSRPAQYQVEAQGVAIGRTNQATETSPTITAKAKSGSVRVN
ncbi:DUF4097 family beta strand repeat protein [Lactobacillus sp. CC-MHH1034]|uniref:DUF4097 family beta strand repeat-containing protein n=1 Tax=Agrilactobacillus fermenti TaxID=2586909 RepID=UPI001E534751|nr:DUF4097 family beta strand repeat-containing protein [Agrilactobacillus fermenti]MCD2255566.1 DUF4097 family beta strand repeat protein [Agrilactobacillus fermenti]